MQAGKVGGQVGKGHAAGHQKKRNISETAATGHSNPNVMNNAANNGASLLGQGIDPLHMN